MPRSLDESLARMREEHPYFCEVVLRAPDLQEARRAAQALLQRTAEPLRAAGHRFAATDAAVARECLGVLGDLFSERGEALAGASALAAIKRLLAGGEVQGARAAFTEDLRHLFRGAQARAGIGERTTPAYLGGGPGASRSRSAYLDRVARQAHEGLDRHPSGLDEALSAERRALHRRWLETCECVAGEGSWHSELTAAAADHAALGALMRLERSEREGMQAAADCARPVRLSPRMVSLLALGAPAQAIRGACLPTAEEVAAARHTDKPRLYTRRAPSAARLSPLAAVPPWQRYGGAPLTPAGPAPEAELAGAMETLAGQQEVREVRIAGGEPFLLSDRNLNRLVERLAGVEHLERIVLKTRFLAALPSRFTPELCEALASANDRVDLRVSARFLASVEVTPATARAVARLARSGITVHAEALLDLGTSRRFAPAALRRALARIGVQSCSFRLLSAKAPLSRRVPLARALMESEEEARRLPGLERFGNVSVVTAEGERRTLQRRRDRQPIGLLPSGERIYEFLARDRELASAPRRRYVDMPIMDYLTRLATLYGEDITAYRTLWYYFLIDASVRSASVLGDALRLGSEQIDAIAEVAERYPLRITPYYLSLIDPDDPRDPIRRQCVPDPAELVDKDGAADPTGEAGDSPLPGLVHRYPDRVLVLTTSTCLVHCRHCNRKRLWCNGGPRAERPDAEAVAAYLGSHPRVREVILSGGDPLTLPRSDLQHWLEVLRGLPQVEVLRVGTRTPVVQPHAVDDELCRLLAGPVPLWVHTHFNHPREVTTEAASACKRLRSAGVGVHNQTVLLRGVNDDPTTMIALCRRLLGIGVRPYYLYHCDPALGVAHFRTPVSRGLEILAALRGRVSGLAQPLYAVDLPDGGGKVHLEPDSVIERTGQTLRLRSFDGTIRDYPDG